MNPIEPIQSNPSSVAHFRSGGRFEYDEDSRLCEFHESGGRDGDGASSRSYFLFQTARGAFVAVTETRRGDAVDAVAERLTKARAVRWALSWSFEPRMAAIVGEFVARAPKSEACRVGRHRRGVTTSL